MEHKKWLAYWKKSLSDSLKTDIDIEKLKHFEIEDFKVNSQSIDQIEIAKIGRNWKPSKF